ncbi:hypothetical protein MIND_00216600 [Mycena indigotica]|uniref:Uncharacterized protein n=1 Tax=Mycena indigotica TaxID=2126181 RepID=A0A8H6T6Y9_9AGAR|nr:uncharacterized protein MIND_00216600 [Mycena indigotica]KAF7312045.1 hypothetical protein MIND_00216600 [Mycena indigotica]
MARSMLQAALIAVALSSLPQSSLVHGVPVPAGKKFATTISESFATTIQAGQLPPDLASIIASLQNEALQGLEGRCDGNQWTIRGERVDRAIAATYMERVAKGEVGHGDVPWVS